MVLITFYNNRKNLFFDRVNVQSTGRSNKPDRNGGQREGDSHLKTTSETRLPARSIGDGFENENEKKPIRPLSG